MRRYGHVGYVSAVERLSFIEVLLDNMLSVNSNIGANAGMLAMRNAIANKNTAVERLSSGFRINSAADDAAGKAVVGKLTKDIQGVNVAIRKDRKSVV